VVFLEEVSKYSFIKKLTGSFMNDRLKKFWKSGKGTTASQADRALEHTCAGRVVSALTFIVIIICLGLWIGFFLALNDQLLTQNSSGNAVTNLTCLVFFGGLVIALFIGALAGNFLRRSFWKMLVKRYK
jgi:hypothetical protein